MSNGVPSVPGGATSPGGTFQNLEALIDYQRIGQYTNRIWYVVEIVSMQTSSTLPGYRIRKTGARMGIGGASGPTWNGSESSKNNQHVNFKPNEDMTGKRMYIGQNNFSNAPVPHLHVLEGVHWTQQGETTEMKFCELKIISYSDKNYTNEIVYPAGYSQNYIMMLKGDIEYFCRVDACQLTDVYPGESFGVAEIGRSDTIGVPASQLGGKNVWIHVPANTPYWPGNGNEPQVGMHIGAALMKPTQGDIQNQIRECYTIGEVLTSPPKSKSTFNDVKNLTFCNGQPNARPPVGGGRYYSPDPPERSCSAKFNEDKWDDDGNYIKNSEVVSEPSCITCAGEGVGTTKDIYRLAEFSHKAHVRAGWSCNFSNLKYSAMEFKNEVIAGEDVSQKDIAYKAVVQSAMYKEKFAALPMGMTSTFVTGGEHMFETDPVLTVDENGDPVDTWVGPSNYWWHLSATMSESINFMKAYRTTNRISADRVKPHVDVGTDGRLAEKDIYYSVENLSTQQLKPFIEKINNYGLTLKAGAQKGIWKIQANMSLNATEGQTIGDDFANKQFSSVGYGLTVDIEAEDFFEAIAYQRPPGISKEVYDATVQKKFEDSLRVSIDFGSFSMSRIRYSEFKTNADGSLYLEKDPDTDEWKPVLKTDSTGQATKVIEHMQNTFGKFQSAAISYNYSNHNGWGMTASTALNTDSDGKVDWDSLMQNLRLNFCNNDPEDKVRWTASLDSTGLIQTNISRSFELSKGDVTLPGGAPASCYIDVGASCTYGGLVKGFETNKGEKNSFGDFIIEPSLSLQGEIDPFNQLGGKASLLSGLQYAVDLIDGNTSIGKAWQKVYAASWLDPTHGDKFTSSFTFKAKSNIYDFDHSYASIGFGLDYQMQKQLVDLGRTLGKLVFTARLSGHIGWGGAGSGPIVNEGTVGFITYNAVITWRNNLLGFFGLPVNLHPRIGFAGAMTFNFGQKARALEGKPPGTAHPDPGVVAVQDGFRHTIHLGLIGFEFTQVDGFRQHMEAQHVPLLASIPILSIISQCPVLKNIGITEESVWRYVIRTTPVRTLVAIGAAVSECDAKRREEINKHWQACVVAQRGKHNSVLACPDDKYLKRVSLPNGQRRDYPQPKGQLAQPWMGEYWSTKVDPATGDPSKETVYDPDAQRYNGHWNVKNKKAGTPASTTYVPNKEHNHNISGPWFTNWYNTEDWDRGTNDFQTKPTGEGQGEDVACCIRSKSLQNWILGLPAPYKNPNTGKWERIYCGTNQATGLPDCKLSERQCGQFAMEIVQQNWDRNFDRCDCVRKEVAKLLTQKYYAHFWSTQHGHQSNDYHGELYEGDYAGPGAQTKGVLNHVIMAIDKFTLDTYLEGGHDVKDKQFRDQFRDKLHQYLIQTLGNGNAGTNPSIGADYPNSKEGKSGKYESLQDILGYVDELWGDPGGKDNPFDICGDILMPVLNTAINFTMTVGGGILNATQKVATLAVGTAWKLTPMYWLFGWGKKKDKDMFDSGSNETDIGVVAIDGVWQAGTACGKNNRPRKVAGPGGTVETAEDDCYEGYSNYMYWKRNYFPRIVNYYPYLKMLHQLYTLSHNDGDPNNKTGLMSEKYSIPFNSGTGGNNYYTNCTGATTPFPCRGDGLHTWKNVHIHETKYFGLGRMLPTDVIATAMAIHHGDWKYYDHKANFPNIGDCSRALSPTRGPLSGGTPARWMTAQQLATSYCRMYIDSAGRTAWADPWASPKPTRTDCDRAATEEETEYEADTNFDGEDNEADSEVKNTYQKAFYDVVRDQPTEYDKCPMHTFTRLNASNVTWDATLTDWQHPITEHHTKTAGGFTSPNCDGRVTYDKHEGFLGHTRAPGDWNSQSAFMFAVEKIMQTYRRAWAATMLTRLPLGWTGIWSTNFTPNGGAAGASSNIYASRTDTFTNFHVAYSSFVAANFLGSGKISLMTTDSKPTPRRAGNLISLAQLNNFADFFKKGQNLTQPSQGNNVDRIALQYAVQSLKNYTYVMSDALRAGIFIQLWWIDVLKGTDGTVQSHGFGSDFIIKKVIDEKWIEQDPDTGKYTKTDNNKINAFIKYFYTTYFNEDHSADVSGSDADACVSPSIEWVFKGGKYKQWGNIYNFDASKNVYPTHPELNFVSSLLKKMGSLYKLNKAYYDWIFEGGSKPIGAPNNSITIFRSGSPLILTGMNSFLKSQLKQLWDHNSIINFTSHTGGTRAFYANMIMDAMGGADYVGSECGNALNYRPFLLDTHLDAILGDGGSHPLANTSVQAFGVKGSGEGDPNSATATTVGSHPATKLTGRIHQGIETIAEAAKLRQDTIIQEAGDINEQVDSNSYCANKLTDTY